MNRDTAEGKFDQIKGKVKQSVGEAFGDHSLANSGAADQVKGAAKEGWACPSDAAIARAYGTHSFRRARRLLAYIEEQGLIVCQLDGAGRRIVTLVELAWATAPGDPNAEDSPAEERCASPSP